MLACLERNVVDAVRVAVVQALELRRMEEDLDGAEVLHGRDDKCAVLSESLVDKSAETMQAERQYLAR